MPKMTNSLRTVFLFGFFTAMTARAEEADLATLRQHYVDQGYGMFVCYSTVTYTDDKVQFAHSNLNVDTFTPTASIKAATDQWAATAKAAGMKYGIFTAKHIDGFALWNTPKSTYDVASTSWYNNPASPNYHVDVVKSYADSFRAQGLGVGLYYSVWDAHNGIGTKYYPDDPTVPQLTDAERTAYVKEELHHLLTHYGPIDCLFIDAWAYYDVPDRNYGVNNLSPDYQEVYRYVKRISPNTLLMQNNGEQYLNHTDIVSYEHYNQPLPPAGNTLPTEVSTTLRADGQWFFSASRPDPLKSAHLIGSEIRLSNSRNATYALDVTPDKSGRIPADQVARLMEVKAYLAGLRPGNLAFGKVAKESSGYHAASSPLTADLAVDGDMASFASTDDGDTHPWLMVDLGKTTAIGEVDLYNRTDGCRGRLRDIRIEILAADGTTVLAASPVLNPGNVMGGGKNDYYYSGPGSLTWSVGRVVTGQFVRVIRKAEGNTDPNQYILSLAEVEVYAAPEPRHAGAVGNRPAG